MMFFWAEIGQTRGFRQNNMADFQNWEVFRISNLPVHTLTTITSRNGRGLATAPARFLHRFLFIRSAALAWGICKHWRENKRQSGRRGTAGDELAPSPLYAISLSETHTHAHTGTGTPARWRCVDWRPVFLANSDPQWCLLIFVSEFGSYNHYMTCIKWHNARESGGLVV